MYRWLRNAQKSTLSLAALCTLLIDCTPSFADTLAWSNPGSGNFNTPNNWLPVGAPDVNDFVSFEYGSGNPYTVTFPGPFSEPGLTANYTTSHLRLNDSGVTFRGSTESFNGKSTYTVASTDLTEANRGIIIGARVGENAQLTISPPSPVCCGALTSFRGAAATIGDVFGGSGTLNVTGGEFRVTGSDFFESQLIIGNHGTGTLNLNNGADVNVTGHNSNVSLGHYPNGVGAVTISGAGSTWTNNDRLWVGELGTGTLTIQNGGSLITSSAAGSTNVIGTYTGSNGMVTVTNPGSTWTYSNELRVGNNGHGTLVISNGGSVINTNPAVSTRIFGSINFDGVFGSGMATVTGAGSNWSTAGDLDISSSGINTLTIQAGGHVTSASSRIGGAIGLGSGQVLVTGGGSTWTVTAGPLALGTDNRPGTLTINPGAAVNVAQDIDLFSNGVLVLQGGTLTATDIGLNNLPFTGQFTWTSGTLHVGTFRGSLLNQAGTLAPGQSAGLTTIQGGYIQQPAGALEIEINATQFDRVSVAGTATLGGQLQLALLAGDLPNAIQAFPVLSASSISGAFSNVASGQRLMTADGLGSFLVHYGPGSPFDQNKIVLAAFEAAPLPGDYNQNGTVDAADYTRWRNNLGSGTSLPNDDTPGVGPDDYTRWRTHFGQTAGSGSAASANATVPEPATLVMLILAAAGLCLRRGRAA